MAKIDLRYISNRELLNLPLKELPLEVEGSVVNACLEELYGELEAKGINFRPHLWISTEWFSPDGIPGIAAPFYLFHPRLMRLERQMIGEVEGSTQKSVMKLLRHECGHAIDNAFRLRHRKGRKALFGSSSEDYPDDYEPKLYSKNFVKHLGDGYAQAHPEEDWAETFAVWLGQNNWPHQYASWPALKKLQYVNMTMLELRGTQQPTSNFKTYEELKNLNLTVKQYYQAKRRRLGLARKSFSKDIQTLSTYRATRRGLTLKDIVRAQKSDICKKVAKSSGEPQYNIKRLYQKLDRELKTTELYNSPVNQKVKEELYQVMMNRTPKLIKKGSHRIIM
jgi:hypothetical protein